MKNLEFDTMDLIESVCSVMDTVWEIIPTRKKVYIWKDYIFSEYQKMEIDYYEMIHNLAGEYVYPADRGLWLESFSHESLLQFINSGQKSKRLEVRIQGKPFGFEWHEITLTSVRKGSENTVFMLTRNINELKRTEIIDLAVRNEYDYVIYVEADKNSYIMYSANRESGTILPHVAGDNYEEDMAEYNDINCIEEDRQSIIDNMRLENVLKKMESSGEYILYNGQWENGKITYKKLHFSYFDKEQRILLLTRTDITEVRLEKDQRIMLQDALSVANVANQAKSDFLSRMSHDIRTPMNAIIGMTAIAGTHVDDRERVLDCLSKITSSSKLLLGLINEVLDMSKIESGRIVLSEQEFNLGRLLQDLVTLLQPEIEAKGHTFDIHLLRVDHEQVVGDFQRIQQLFMNILSNAVKYTRDGGHILLEIKEKASKMEGYGCFEFIFSDDGIGMTQEFLNKLFVPFERADDLEIRTIQGTGLGMAISKNIVQMMGGDIQVESVYGKGSHFTVSINLKLCDSEQLDAEILVDLPVLVVDDDQVVCKDTCACLVDLGMRSEWVPSGQEGLERIVKAHNEDRDYFAAIIDLKMPGMDGIETTRKIREAVGLDVPIIIISAYDCAEYEIEAKAAGANGFISKPLFKSKLAYLLKKFAQKEPLQELEEKEDYYCDFKEKRILLVEDNALNMEIAVEILSSTGAKVDTAENGKIALDMFSNSLDHYYNLILMDVQMPVMNGYESSCAIRALQRADAKQIPIIAMTANAFAEDVFMAKQAGMNQHLAKPIDIPLLMGAMERWLLGR